MGGGLTRPCDAFCSLWALHVRTKIAQIHEKIPPPLPLLCASHHSDLVAVQAIYGSSSAPRRPPNKLITTETHRQHTHLSTRDRVSSPTQTTRQTFESEVELQKLVAAVSNTRTPGTTHSQAKSDANNA